MFKITSRFYVIYGDGIPIYVGYTNRTVKRRFTEHQHDKDFEQYAKVKAEELKDEKMSFDFTWDYIKTCENADLVSKREAELVSKYNTQCTEYQKAVGGGQTWASEKSFVKSNQNNPRFIGMTTSQVKASLSSLKYERVLLSNFVGGMKPNENAWLHDFAGGMKSQDQDWLHNLVNHIELKEQSWLGSFVNHIKPKEHIWLGSFVGSINSAEHTWLSHFVSNIKPKEQVWIKNFVSNLILRGVK